MWGLHATADCFSAATQLRRPTHIPRLPRSPCNQHRHHGRPPATQVTLNKIFDWYFVDFGATKAARLSFLLPHLPPATRRALAGLLQADPEAADIKVAYRPYDWSLNAAG